MNQPLPSLSYATPARTRPFDFGFLGYCPFLFYLCSIAVSAAVFAFNGYVLHESGGFFGPEMNLICGILIAAAAFIPICVFLAVLLLIIEDIKPTLEPSTSLLFWIMCGALAGFLATIPPTIDALTFTHIRYEGELEIEGRGNTVRLIAFCLSPFLTLLFAFRRVQRA